MSVEPPINLMGGNRLFDDPAPHDEAPASIVLNETVRLELDHALRRSRQERDHLLFEVAKSEQGLDDLRIRLKHTEGRIGDLRSALGITEGEP